MRIAYVVGTYPSRSETFIAREIEALEARGIGVEVFPLWRGRDAPSVRPVHRCGSVELRAQLAWPMANVRWQLYFLARMPREGMAALRALFRLNTALGMARRMQALGIARVHAQFANAPSTAGWVAASLLGVPFSFAVHARDVFVEPQFLAAKARAADRIIACNSAAAARTRELVSPPDRQKVELVYHGLPLDEYLFRPERAARRPLLLGVGRFVEKKGLVHLVRAVSLLRQQGRDIGCWLIGDGPRRKALEREIAALGLGDAVSLKGWMGPAELRAAYERASALVVPSIVARDGDMDGLPNVLLEAAATGLPIVATSVGGIGDFVQDRATGLVATPADPDDLATKIHSALSEPEAAMNRARNARAEVEARFRIDRCADALADALGIGSGPDPA